MNTASYALGSGEGHRRWFLDTTMTIKAGGEATGGAFTMLECEAPEGFAPPLHVHHREDECFYLVDGELSVHCGDDTWVVAEGGFVFLPRGVPHAFVVSRGPARMLQITSPAGFEAFVDELGRPPADDGLPAPGAPDVAALVEIAGRHGYEVVGPPSTLGPGSGEGHGGKPFPPPAS
jgi:mannose-6-phosphate isomerase-like protein (cupin superfamily)